jgi:DUF1680 family protein
MTVLRPVDASGVRVRDGFWGERLAVNRERTIPHGKAELDRVGTLTNFRLAAGVPGRYQALGEPIGQVFPFLDSDVYKWLEAVGWELGRAPDAELAATADEVIAAVAAAQRPDGYLNTFVQVVAGGEPYRDMEWGHELYCFGHLVQAAVAWHRALGDDRLLEIAMRTADHAEAALGPAGRETVDGHPEIEMALVELARSTGEQRYLEFARLLVERRGHGLLAQGRFGAPYWQDHETVRNAAEVAGHSVRQLYLDAGAVDVAVETGDRELLEAVGRRWRNMLATRTYLTGGVGSRHIDEAFGDPFELPPDQAYTETCAAIASVMLAWRLLLATGDPQAADVIERTILNGILPALSRDGTTFFYVNPLQRRTHRVADHPGIGERGGGRRAPWFACACCPPNLMRTLSSWEAILATTDMRGVQLHQYASGDIRAILAGGDEVDLKVETDYPWSGRIAVTVGATPVTPWTLSLRVPGWCRSATIAVGDGEPQAVATGARSVQLDRAWRAGETVILDLAMPVRITEPDRRVDAIRGTLAIERGPLVYCLETADLPPGVELEDVVIEASVEPEPVHRPDLGTAVIGLRVPAFVRRGDGRSGDEPIEVGAIPYYLWANRGVEAMRVWVPRRDLCLRSSAWLRGVAR